MKYRYACTKEMGIIDIFELTDAERNSGFTCPSCMIELIPRMGQVRERHFAHKTDDAYCSKETYLHRVAKVTLFKTLIDCQQAGKPFYVSFQQTCSGNPLFKDLPGLESEKCNQKHLIEVDILQFYDQINLETPYGNHIPDILLKNSKTNKVLFLEICVTHPCSPEKLATKIPIIEIAIQGEQDIEALTTGHLKESLSGALPDNEQELHIQFHNVSRKISDDKMKHCQCHSQRLMVFVVQAKNDVPQVFSEIWEEPLTMKNVSTFLRKNKNKYTFCLFSLLPPKVGYSIRKYLQRQFFYLGIDLLKKLNHPYLWKHEGKTKARTARF